MKKTAKNGKKRENSTQPAAGKPGGGEKTSPENDCKYYMQYKASPVPTITWRRKGRYFIIDDCNDSAQKLTRQDISDCTGKSAKTLFPDNPEIVNTLKKCYREKSTCSLNVEYSLNGTEEILFLEITCAFINSVFILMQVVNITERVITLNALRESEEKIRNIAEESPNMIFINVEGRVVYANKLCQEMMGYTREEFYSPDFNFMQLIAPDSIETIKASFTAHQQGREIEPYEYQLVTKEKKIVDVIITTKLVNFRNKSGILGIITDISTRKKVENALRDSEQRFRDTVNMLPQIIFEMDCKGIITFTNRNGYEITGYQPEDLEKGLNFRDFFIPESKKKANKNFQKRLQGEISTGVEYSVLKKDGSTLDVLIYSTQMRDHSGALAGLRGVLVDITERKKAEKERRNLERQLYQAQKMESIGRLAGGIAHDFNNILTAILGWAEMLESHLENAGTIEKEAVNVIIKGTKRASDLTGQLLGFARGGKYNPVLLNLNEVICDSLHVSEKIFEKNIEIVYELNEDIHMILADRSQIEQVFTNLIINARDAMPEGGTIIFRTRNEELKKEEDDSFIGLKPGRYVKIEVEDSGIGMSKEIVDRMFEPFFTTKKEGKGTGLGLATVYGIIKNHHGDIICESTPGNGTIFTISLPASLKTGKEGKKAQPRSFKRSEADILIVDDEEIVRELLKMQLESIGYKTRLACDGAEAVSIYKNAEKKPDLVLLDIVMPKKSGKQTFRELKKIDPGVKVVLISGYSKDNRIKEIIRSGAKAFIHKPFEFKDMSRVIEQVLRS